MSKCIGSIKSRLKAVGSRIRKGCEAISISLEELAKKAKLSLDYICEIENGERAPSFQALSRISRVLKTSPEVLLTGYKASPHKLNLIFNAKEKAKLKKLLGKIEELCAAM
ncbi:MAG TPA: helix-turn-helix transcriptional regulator [Candidatus Nanoarchaeia archaeon]|nr:helix-turn-helix transcriptional regulator [Candidatus Nanoarchaeia archaeon]